MSSCLAQRAENAQAAGGFAPGARASASANATLDSVVGNRPSPVKKELGLGGVVYRVTPQAVVIGLMDRLFLVAALRLLLSRRGSSWRAAPQLSQR
ncbi:hypothetical protein [Asaia platycodi]|uniref:hypothetical protein n=1 Tax=Asaia platycodi TaxID=610243 RepID=UPI000AA5A435|nr:hypothetical protein [Asaia platycodi]